MPTLVHHYDKKTGKTLVYESTPHYDPVTKQSRPKRKYLGTLDPETNELIPTSGRRGRKPGVKNTPKNKTTNTPDIKDIPYADLQQAVLNRDNEIAALKDQINTLKSNLEKYEKAFASISKAMSSLE